MLEQGYCPVWTGYLERQGDWAVREKEENAGLLVSIITVSYNSEKSIRRTIESVLNQTYSKIEYHIVDGLSTDNTIEIAREYDEKFAEKGIKYIISSERDNGIYDAMNKGILRSAGKIVGIINSDDWYEKNAVESAVNTYRETEFDYYYADINLIKENGKKIVKHSKQKRIVTSRHWNHPGSFVKRQVYKELGLFRCEGIHDDFVFFLRVKRAGKKIVIQNELHSNFTVGGVSNDKSLRKCRKRCLDRYKCYRNNGYSRLYFIECVLMEVMKYLVS